MQIEKHDKKFASKYWLTTTTINLFDRVDDKCELLKHQDSAILDALQKPYDQYIYGGIAHTPFIFRAGYMFGDECNVRLLHKKRGNRSIFMELKEDGSEGIRMERTTISPDSPSNELIVAISTSLEIKDSDLECLEPSTKHLMRFDTLSKCFDNLSSYSQLERYRDDIFYEIRDLCKKYDITTIHMVASTSVAFSFMLGQAMSDTHDPVVIVYHYERQNEKHRYPWGIRIMSNAESSLVHV